MTSRERVQHTLRREPTDRVPIFVWYHPDTAQRLAQTLEIPPDIVDVAMGNDIEMTWIGNNYAMEGIIHERDGERHTDAWEIEWEKQGSFNQIVREPLAGADEPVVDAYQFPHQHIDDLVSLLDSLGGFSRDAFLGADVSPCAFEMHNRLRGMEDSLVDLITDNKASMRLLNRCGTFAAELAHRALDRYDLQMLWTGDDVGSQSAMMMSPELWRTHIRPALQRVVEAAREHAVLVAYHSCGSIRPIVQDLIEMGIDALNPIQPLAADMDPATLKREYGSALTFIGGVDTQELLTNSAPTTVRRETERLIEHMTTDGGGYVLGGSHTIAPETPIENIFAMLAAAGLTEEQIRDTAGSLRE